MDPEAGVTSISEYIEGALRSTRKRDRTAHRNALARHEPGEITDAIIAAIRRAEAKNDYFRLCDLLAELGGEAGIEFLLREARENTRFPRHPIRAIAHSRHPRAVPILVEMMHNGKKKQRRSAMIALGECGATQAIEPLCRVVETKGSKEQSAEALRILRRMGHPNHLAHRALKDGAVSDHECARALQAMEVLFVFAFPLSYRPFDAERFLDDMINRGREPRDRAGAVLLRLREQRTLLRAAGPATGERLLRPSAGTTHGRTEELLRASSLSEMPDPPFRARWWRRALELLARYLVRRGK